MHKKIQSFIILTAVITLIVVGFSFVDKVSAGVSHNVSGFAWSDNIGWISFNNFSDNSSIDYGVALDVNGGGDFSGYAWSDNIGWIDFSPTSGYPEAPYHGARLESDNTVTGWVYAVVGGDFVDGWDGWIKMSGIWDDGSETGDYGVSLSGDNFVGYAWGSDVVGWVDFSISVKKTGGAPACSDSIDNDGDGFIDYPNDPGCVSGADDDEFDSVVPECNDNLDNDGDGKTDFDGNGGVPDPGCSSPADDDEIDIITECSDGIDNADPEDTYIDMADPGCGSPSDNDETDLSYSFYMTKSGNMSVNVVSNSGDTTSGTAVISIVPIGEFVSDISLFVQDVTPTILGGAYNFTDTLIDVSEYGTGSEFSITVPDTILSGTYIITIRGSGDSLDRTIDVTLSVNRTDPGYGEF